MGQIIYNTTTINIADEAVARADAMTQHLFRDGVSFMLILEGTNDDGDDVSSSLWMAPQIPVQFAYRAFETVELDREVFGRQLQDAKDDGFFLLSGADVPLPYAFVGDDAGGESDGTQ